MKIFTSAQVHELDKYTIENEPIKSVDLMERAAQALTQAITDSWGNNTPVILFAGPGNNGGDALAVARMLIEKDYNVTAYLFNISGHLSEDCLANKKRLIEKRSKALIEVTQEFEPPQLEEGMLIVDGLFGTEERYGSILIDQINANTTYGSYKKIKAFAKADLWRSDATVVSYGKTITDEAELSNSVAYFKSSVVSDSYYDYAWNFPLHV